MFMPVKTTGVFLGTDGKSAKFKIGDKEYDIDPQDIYSPEFDSFNDVQRGTAVVLSLDGWWARNKGVT